MWPEALVNDLNHEVAASAGSAMKAVLKGPAIARLMLRSAVYSLIDLLGPMPREYV